MERSYIRNNRASRNKFWIRHGGESWVCNTCGDEVQEWIMYIQCTERCSTRLKRRRDAPANEESRRLRKSSKIRTHTAAIRVLLSSACVSLQPSKAWQTYRSNSRMPSSFDKPLIFDQISNRSSLTCPNTNSSAKTNECATAFRCHICFPNCSLILVCGCVSVAWDR